MGELVEHMRLLGWKDSFIISRTVVGMCHNTGQPHHGQGRVNLQQTVSLGCNIISIIEYWYCHITGLANPKCK